MKHIFKKLHKGHNQEPNRTNETPPPQPSPSCATDHQRPMSGNSPTSPSTSSPAPDTVPPSAGYAGLCRHVVGGGVPGSVSSSDQRVEFGGSDPRGDSAELGRPSSDGYRQG
ncbi:hypothetical protein SLEP1_g36597 [Rubroshorea leprosula]|uniref:Uncharacterized protein n=1 Tax=Rubroshorea leprosula TaxID=152421 RepID=A0AAV5KRZ4_9ROSI|nr:hypothetical protein SLEP1_g36597 [Rubroshorea leprosula]